MISVENDGTAQLFLVNVDVSVMDNCTHLEGLSSEIHYRGKCVCMCVCLGGGGVDVTLGGM